MANDCFSCGFMTGRDDEAIVFQSFGAAVFISPTTGEYSKINLDVSRVPFPWTEGFTTLVCGAIYDQESGLLRYVDAYPAGLGNNNAARVRFDLDEANWMEDNEALGLYKKRRYLFQKSIK